MRSTTVSNASRRPISGLGWIAAWRNTRDGLIHAWTNERPVRQEIVVLAIAVVAVPFVANDVRHAILLVASVLFPLIVELLNVAIETVCDRITTDRDPLVKIAKDVGSAAVFLSILPALALWGEALWSAGAL